MCAITGWSPVPSSIGRWGESWAESLPGKSKSKRHWLHAFYMRSPPSGASFRSNLKELLNGTCASSTTDMLVSLIRPDFQVSPGI